MIMQYLVRNTFVFLIALRRTDSYRSGIRLAFFSLALCLGGVTDASALQRVGGFTPGPPGKIGPVGPQYAPVVNAAQDFTIGGRETTQVALRWWNKGAPQTLIYRSVNGGQWTTIKTYGEIPVDTYVDFQDLNAASNAENCYVVAVTDGVNSWSALSTPMRCAFTRDGRTSDGQPLTVHRLQLRIRVPNVSGAATDDDVEIRLQSPSWLVPTVTNWSPAGNSTWIDSTANDFERGSDRTYDLMLTNVAQVSDITLITISKPKGTDDMCIAELQLLIDGQSAFQRTFGDQAATCAWVTAANLLAVTFNDLRTSDAWNNLGLPTFTGINGAGLRSRVEATFAHKLHGKGEIRNGGTTTSQRISESKLHVSVPIIVNDTPLGDVDSTVYFDLVMSPVIVNGTAATVLSVENVDADSFDLLALFFPVVVTPILYGISTEIEDQVAALDSFTIDQPPLPGTRTCFTPDAGIGLCFDSSARWQGYAPVASSPALSR